MIYVYIHIPRTAGTSFRLYAEEVLGKGAILPIYGVDINNPIDCIRARGLQGIELIRGHITTACMEALPEGTLAFTFLRDPMTRVPSLFQYIKRDGRHPLHSMIGGMTLEDFVYSGLSLEVDNGMVRQLCGTEPELPQEPYSPRAHRHTPYGNVTSEMLAHSLQWLRKFVVVGTTENMAEAYRALWARTGWPSKPIRHANRSKVGEYTDKDLQAVRDHNVWDMQLCREVRSWQSR